MKDEIFDEVYQSKLNGFADGKSYGYFEKKYKYSSAEAVRSDFRRELRRRNLDHYIPKESPVIGVMDIECLPMRAYTFGLFDQNIYPEQVIDDSCLLSWAGKYLNGPEITSDVLTSKEAVNKDDKRIVESCWRYLSSCDAVIGHNWNGYDGKMLNVFFLLYDLPPLKPVVIDTLSTARKYFRFASNSLEYINQRLGIRNKLSNEGFALWRKCHEGNQESLDELLDYNKGDILATEDLFYRVRPYVRNFNVGLYNEVEERQCPICGSNDLSNEGFYYTSAGKWESIRCQNCGCLSRAKTNLFTKEKKRSLLINS